MIPNPDSNELAWIAGFIDGEGSLGIHRQRDKRKGPEYAAFRASLQVSNAQSAALERIKASLGAGRIIQVAPRNLFNAAQYRYVLRDQPLRDPLYWLRPFLFLKAEQADLVLEFLVSRYCVRGRGRYAAFTPREHKIHGRLARINQRGPQRLEVSYA